MTYFHLTTTADIETFTGWFTVRRQSTSHERRYRVIEGELAKLPGSEVTVREVGPTPLAFPDNYGGNVHVTIDAWEVRGVQIEQYVLPGADLFGEFLGRDDVSEGVFGIYEESKTPFAFWDGDGVVLLRFDTERSEPSDRGFYPDVHHFPLWRTVPALLHSWGVDYRIDEDPIRPAALYEVLKSDDLRSAEGVDRVLAYAASVAHGDGSAWIAVDNRAQARRIRHFFLTATRDFGDQRATWRDALDQCLPTTFSNNPIYPKYPNRIEFVLGRWERLPLYQRADPLPAATSYL